MPKTSPSGGVCYFWIVPLLSRRTLLLLIPGGIVAGLALPVLSSDSAILSALCRALFFLDADPRPEDLQLGEAAAALLNSLPTAARWQLRGDLRAVEVAAVVLIGTRLSVAEREPARLLLQHLRAGARGDALARLQSLCALACYGHPAVQAELGYEGPPP